MINIHAEELLSIEQARAMLPGVGKATIARWIAAGKLESIKLGVRRFTSVEAIARMAEPGPSSQTPTGLRRRSVASTEVDTELDAILGLSPA